MKTVQTTYAGDLTLESTVPELGLLERAPLKKTESQRRLVDRGAVGMLWQGVWETLVRKMAYYNSGSVELALALMKEILDHDLVDAKLVGESQGELWKASLFNEPAKCGIAAIEFVISFLRRHEIKDAAAEWGGHAEVARGLKKRRYGDPSTDPTGAKDNNGQITQRERLVEWLLLSLNRDTINVRLSKNMLKPISPYLIASAVIALIRPGPSPAIKDPFDEEEDARSSSQESHPFRRSVAAASLDFSIPDYPALYVGIEDYTGTATQRPAPSAQRPTPNHFLTLLFAIHRSELK